MKFHTKKYPEGELLLPAHLGIQEYNAGDFESKESEDAFFANQGKEDEEPERVILPSDKRKKKPVYLKKCRRCKKDFQAFAVQQFCRPCLVKMEEGGHGR